jgi:hypothetical protein
MVMKMLLGNSFLRGISVLAFLMTPAIVYCGMASSTSFLVTRSVFDNGGGVSSSSSYRLHSSLGQGSSVSSSTSANFNLYSGFNSIPDTDGDVIPDDVDNCLTTANSDQLDSDNDRLGDICDPDDDNDGLDDIVENTLGTNPLVADSDGDGLSDFTEVSAGDPYSYQAGVDTDPNNSDTDGDGMLDGADLDPLVAHIGDGDLAPRGAPDGIINVADLLIAHQIALELITPTAIDRSHGDVYPPGTPDGVIDISDILLMRQLILTQP